jgi:integrase
VWKLAADHGKCLSGAEHNPFRGVARWAEPEERTRVLSAEEFERLLDAARASDWSRLYLRVLMAATTGGRPGEVERLRWGDLDLTQRMATVPRDEHTGRRSHDRFGDLRKVPRGEQARRERSLGHEDRLTAKTRVNDTSN